MSAGIVAQIESAPLLTAATLPDGGLAAVQGRAVGRALLESPISGVSAIGYRVLVELIFSDGPRRFDFAQINDFEVEDDSGRASVSTAGAVLVLGHEYAQDNIQGGSLSASVLRLLAERGEAVRRIPQSFTWHEYFLEQGETVYVCGQARHVIDTTQDPIHYRQNAYKPSLGRPSSGALVVADLHRDELLRTLREAPGTLSALGGA